MDGLFVLGPGESIGRGAYTVDEIALRPGAGVEEETNDAEIASAYIPESKPSRYRDGWLPG